MIQMKESEKGKSFFATTHKHMQPITKDLQVDIASFSGQKKVQRH